MKNYKLLLATMFTAASTLFWQPLALGDDSSSGGGATNDAVKAAVQQLEADVIYYTIGIDIASLINNSIKATTVSPLGDSDKIDKIVTINDGGSGSASSDGTVTFNGNSLMARLGYVISSVMGNLYNKLFVGYPVNATTKTTQPDISNIIAAQADNFYRINTHVSPTDGAKQLPTSKEINNAYKISRNLLLNQIAYETTSDSLRQLLDRSALLADPYNAIPAALKFEPSHLGLQATNTKATATPGKSADTQEFTPADQSLTTLPLTPAGGLSLDPSSTTAGDNELDSSLLLRHEGYDDATAKIALGAIANIIMLGQAPKTIVLPEATGNEKKYKIFLTTIKTPQDLTDKAAALPANLVTAVPLYTKETGEAQYLGDTKRVQLVRSWLEQLSTYRDYTANYRKGMFSRSLPLSIIVKLYAEHLRTIPTKAPAKDASGNIKVGSDQKPIMSDTKTSIKDIEHAMANEGVLDPKYYVCTDDSDLSTHKCLNRRSVSEVTLEQVYAMNKIVYMLAEMHEDMQSALLMQAMSQLQTQKLADMDQDIKLKQIEDMLMAGCFDPDSPNYGTATCKTGQATTTTQKK